MLNTVNYYQTLESPPKMFDWTLRWPSCITLCRCSDQKCWCLFSISSALPTAHVHVVLTRPADFSKPLVRTEADLPGSADVCFPGAETPVLLKIKLEEMFWCGTCAQSCSMQAARDVVQLSFALNDDTSLCDKDQTYSDIFHNPLALLPRRRNEVKGRQTYTRRPRRPSPRHSPQPDGSAW